MPRLQAGHRALRQRALEGARRQPVEHHQQHAVRPGVEPRHELIGELAAGAGPDDHGGEEQRDAEWAQRAASWRRSRAHDAREDAGFAGVTRL